MNSDMTAKLLDRVAVGFFAVLVAFSLILLVAPSLIVIAISFEPRGYIAFPPSGFSLKWYQSFFANDQLLGSVLVSLRIATQVTIVCILIGVPAAFASVRGRFPWRGGVNAFLLSPQMMPGMVIGVATLFFGAYISFRASDLMLVISLSVFCLPFAIRIVMGRLAGLDPTLDEASSNLGSSRLETFFRVTLPQLAPAISAATAFTFIEAFDNVTVALFTSDVRHRPLSVELYYLVQFDSSPLLAVISTLEIAFSLLVMLIIAKAVGLDRMGR